MQHSKRRRGGRRNAHWQWTDTGLISRSLTGDAPLDCFGARPCTYRCHRRQFTADYYRRGRAAAASLERARPVLPVYCIYREYTMHAARCTATQARSTKPSRRRARRSHTAWQGAGRWRRTENASFAWSRHPGLEEIRVCFFWARQTTPSDIARCENHGGSKRPRRAVTSSACACAYSCSRLREGFSSAPVEHQRDTQQVV